MKKRVENHWLIKVFHHIVMKKHTYNGEYYVCLIFTDISFIEII